eukprot:Cvel_29929.t1-p1 / transcript=Cvel_29929.t1 / gene=Cvel_29929 / organism=Chromera_velia_CCMP2878 / gene_product=hypothetical protein / transcript_product=hypothetical protein / location=Cvel_scaffold4188:9081-10393(+) / protein_length=437 / sequence_SO=supercontig / SO=protein_coding / is_pseudo=false
MEAAGFPLTISETKRKPVVIVGAGPTGLAAALALRKEGFTDISVLEKRNEGEVESERAYAYLIDGRGQRLTNFLGLTNDLASLSVSSRKFQSLTEIRTDGTVNVVQLPVLDPKAIEKFWLPRAAFLRVLQSAVPRVSGDGQGEGGVEGEGIRIEWGTQLEAIRVDEQDTLTVIARREADGSTVEVQPALLLGCDGLNSQVRKWLNEESSLEDSEKKKFRMTKLPSDAAGLFYRILTISPSFPLPVQEGEKESRMTDCESAYAIRGAGTPPLSLGLLPLKQSDRRTANIICWPSHPIWKANTPEKMTAFLKKEFPQLADRMDSFVSPQEVSRFARAPCGQFPSPQYSSALFASFPTQRSTRSRKLPPSSRQQIRSVVALAGDSAHAFSPDLGQGVNSGLEDVCALVGCLREAEKGGEGLGEWVDRYEKDRLPEIKELC